MTLFSRKIAKIWTCMSSTYFAVSGCPDIEVHADTFAKRDADTFRVKCNHTKNAWYLIWNDVRYVGEVGNCSLGSGKYAMSTRPITMVCCLHITLNIML